MLAFTPYRTVTRVVLKLSAFPFCQHQECNRTVTRVVLKLRKGGSTMEEIKDRTVTRVVLKLMYLQLTVTSIL